MGERRPKRLAEKLLQIREALGLTQHEMAECVGERAGIKELTYKNISKYERDKSIPSLEIGLAYARVANVTFEQIVDDEMELDL
jgi:transcriptional regulator with XRE-family HTH domain